FAALRLESILEILERVALGGERIDRAALVGAELECVNQMSLADELVGPSMNAEAAGAHVVVGLAVVEGFVAKIADVAEAVPLAAFLGVVVVEDVVVAQQPVFLEARQDVLSWLALEQRRVGVVDRSVEAEDLAALDQACRLDDAFLGQKVEASEVVIVAEHAPA